MVCVHGCAGAGGQGPCGQRIVMSRMRAMTGALPPLGHNLLFFALSDF